MKTVQKVAILSVSLLTTIATASIAPALSSIMAYFPSADPNLIKLIVTLPALVCIPVSLTPSLLTKKFSKKSILIVATALYTLFGLASAFSPNIYFLLITRALMGLGLGLLTPLSMIIISDYFRGEMEAKYLGYTSAVSNVTGVIFTYIVGGLTELNWRYSFLIYILGIVIILILVAFYPKNVIYKEESSDSNEKEKMNLHVYKYAVITIVGLIASYGAITNVPILIANHHLGTPSTSSFIVSMVTIFAFIIGLIFDKVIKIFKNFTMILFFVVMILGFIALMFSDSLVFITIGSILFGIALGIIVPLAIYLASSCVSKKNVTSAISIITVGIYIGEFASPLVLSFVGNIFGFSGTMGSIYSGVIISIIAGIIYTFDTLFIEGRANKKIKGLDA